MMYIQDIYNKIKGIFKPNKKFYIIDGIKITESSLSNLCWGACLEMLYSLRQIPICETFQLKLAHDYKKTECYKNLHSNTSDLNIPTSGLNIPLNIPIHENCLIKTYESHDFKLNLEKCSTQKTFDFFITKMRVNKLPLLLGVNVGYGLKDVGHLIIICGYGYCDGKNYLLLYNPAKGTKRFYEYPEKFNAVHKVLRLWSIKHLDEKKINKGKLREIDYKKQISFDDKESFLLENISIKYKIPYYELSAIQDLQFLKGQKIELSQTEIVLGKNFEALRHNDYNNFKCLPDFTYKLGYKITRIDNYYNFLKKIGKDLIPNKVKILFIEEFGIKVALHDNEIVIPLNLLDEYAFKKIAYNIQEFTDMLKEKEKSYSIIFKN